MIYVGLINFSNKYNIELELSIALEEYIHYAPTIISKQSLTICYGKLSIEQDMDEVWENESSVLIGRIFDKEGACYFRKKDYENMSNLGKERTLEKIWGKYIYIDDNKDACQFEIVIDSTGQLPFFYYIFPDGSVLFSSDIEIIFKILKNRPEINWTYLCSYLIYGNSSSTQTPFNDIYELPPGCWLKINKYGTGIQPFWDPLSPYRRSVSQEKDAVDILQETLKPWIAPYKNICVSLSGGVDSSSLVYCLKNIKNEDQNLSAINFFHANVKSSNELVYARKVAEETGIKLIELDVSHSLPFDPAAKKQPLNPNKPFPGLISLRWLENVLDNINVNGSSILLSGQGSDHIFMCPPSKKSLTDYIIEKGLKGSINQLTDITQIFRDPYLSILKKNVVSLGNYLFSIRSRKRDINNTQEKPPFWIKKEVIQKTSPSFVHPIYEHLPSSILPGKYEQIDALYEALASIHMEMHHVNPIYYPFLYEPIVEFALSFASYDLFAKGYDRYPLRNAVSEHFKTKTVWRIDKGQTTGLFQLAIKKNMDRILSLCLEGEFAKQGLVDKEGIQQTVMFLSKGHAKDFWPFMRLASIEIFFKYWKEKYHFLS